MIEVATTSLIGNRKINQDRCLVLQDKRTIFLLLADGLGGHPKGEVAAQLLMDVGKHAFTHTPKPIPNPQRFLEEILHTTHKTILKFGEQQHPTINPKTTAVLALIQVGYLFWIHVGDSRLYIFRNRKMLMRSRDHSVLEAMHSTGLPPSLKSKSKAHYRNMVTNCLGSAKKSITAQKNHPVPLESLDAVILCSDGLWGQFTDASLGKYITDHDPVEVISNLLAQKAVQMASPSSDNVTLILLRWLGNLFTKKQKSSFTTTSQTNSLQTSEPDPKLEDAIATLEAVIEEFSSKQ